MFKCLNFKNKENKIIDKVGAIILNDKKNLVVRKKIGDNRAEFIMGLSPNTSLS